jgi:hypothetical protein
MFTYFYVMNDFGFKPHTLIWLNKTKGYYPKDTDVYDPSAPHYGNTNYGKDLTTFTFSTYIYNYMDLRLFFTGLTPMNWSKCRWDPTDDSIPKWWRISWKTQK